MSSKIQHLFAAAAGLALVGIAVPASAQEAVRIRGTIERIEGPVYVVKSRDGSELKLTVTDNPLYVAFVPGTMADIKPGMFVGSAGMMEPDGTQKAIEVHIFPESMRGTGEAHYDWDLISKSKMTNGNVEQAVTGPASRPTGPFWRRVSPMAEMVRGLPSDRAARSTELHCRNAIFD
jgi:hypothetical protein